MQVTMCSDDFTRTSFLHQKSVGHSWHELSGSYCEQDKCLSQVLYCKWTVIPWFLELGTQSVIKPLLPPHRCYFGLTPTGSSTSSIGFVHAEEWEQENLEMVILFPRTRQQDLTAGPLLTKVRSVSSEHWILGCLKKKGIFKGSGKAAKIRGQSLTQRKLPLSSMGVSLEKGQWGLAHKPCIWI